MFPSNSHSQAAAIEPRIDAILIEPDAIKPNAAYEHNASPAPTGSVNFLTNDPNEKYLFIFLFSKQKIPLLPSLSIIFLLLDFFISCFD